MNHDWIRNNLIAYIDGDLNEFDKNSISKHLSECSSCMKDYNYLRSVWLSDSEKAVVPNRIWNNISANVLQKRNNLGFGDFIFGVGKKYSLVFILFISILFGTYLGNKLFDTGNPMSESLNLTEEYYPFEETEFIVTKVDFRR